MMADSWSRFLNKALPLRWQHAFRDSGGIRHLHDSAAVAAACVIVLFKPTLLLLHWRIAKSRRSYYYGISCSESKQIEVYDTLCGGDEERAAIIDDGGDSRLMVFVHGGAWGSGQPWMYRVIANNISRCFCCSRFALVKYPLYTMAEGSIMDQAAAVASAVERAKDILGDAEAPLEVVLCGHSSGANIAALSITMRLCTPHVLLSLAGVFDVCKHYLWESSRGVMEVSPMKAAAGGVENMASCSPSLLTHSQMRETHFLLYHGLHDRTVPCEQTRDFADSLESSGARVSAVYLPAGHAAPILDFLFYDRRTASKRAVAELYDRHCNRN